MLEGPIQNRKAARAQQQDHWNQLFLEAKERAADSRFIGEWITSIQSSGLLRRLSKNDLNLAGVLLRQAIALFHALPTRATPLPQFAAAITGDSHALDFGTPLSGVVMQGVARLGGHSAWQTPAARRDAWQRVGILCDALSQPVLIHNLRFHPGHPLAAFLEQAYQMQEPVYLTTRQLIKFPIHCAQDCRCDTVFVCENPSVVSAIAETCGNQSAPLICVSGNLTTSSQTLLTQLANTGLTIHYHGDFDWPGIRANYVFQRFKAIPWRMSAGDYLAAPKQKPLAGSPQEIPWDRSLQHAMQDVGKIVFEEQVIDTLTKDLLQQT